MRTRTLLVVATTAVALTAGVGVGVANADPTTSPAPSAPSTSAVPKAGDKTGHKARALAARALHGEATLGGKKGTRVVDFQRGTVAQVNGTSITVKSTDGFSATYVVGGTTKVRKDKQAAAIADVAVNDTVRVVAVKDGSTLTATTIRDHKK